MNKKSDSLFTALKIFRLSYWKKQKSLKLRSVCVCIYAINKENYNKRDDNFKRGKNRGSKKALS
jgi:hypothetical protein